MLTKLLIKDASDNQLVLHVVVGAWVEDNDLWVSTVGGDTQPLLNGEDMLAPSIDNIVILNGAKYITKLFIEDKCDLSDEVFYREEDVEENCVPKLDSNVIM